MQHAGLQTLPIVLHPTGCLALPTPATPILLPLGHTRVAVPRPCRCGRHAQTRQMELGTVRYCTASQNTRSYPLELAVVVVAANHLAIALLLADAVQAVVLLAIGILDLVQ
jgi:hypothetical protein